MKLVSKIIALFAIDEIYMSMFGIHVWIVQAQYGEQQVKFSCFQTSP